MKRLKAQKVRTSFDKSYLTPNLNSSSRMISGWLDGKGTFLYFDDRNGETLGTISGNRLYRLAKAIVRHYEMDES